MDKSYNHDLFSLFFLVQPFNSHEWTRHNFSLQYQYKIKKTSDENQESINYGIISWSNTKFSEVKLEELYRGE